MAIDMNADGIVETASDPFDNLIAANAHATDPLTLGPCRGIYVTVAGNLVCRFVDGTADITLAVAADKFYPFRLSHIRATTSATVLVGY